MDGHTLVLLRHGKSDWSGGEPDRDRPLGLRGERQAPEAGRWLASHLHHLDLAVVSPALRARRTWELVAAELDGPPQLRVDDRVYAATDRELLEVVRGLPEEVGAALLVGHNPGLQELVALLTGEWLEMPTSGIAVLAVPGPWSAAGPASSTLTTSGRPPEG